MEDLCQHMGLYNSCCSCPRAPPLCHELDLCSGIYSRACVIITKAVVVGAQGGERHRHLDRL